jgi:crossover junction endodeoxyribonuclease RusA
VEAVMIELPFPPASLSGHNSGHWHAKSATVAKHRRWAMLATLAAKPAVPAEGDIRISLAFYPPDRRGDRTNFANRAKPLIDGIADALKVNDRRFLPTYHYAEPCNPAKVVVCIAQVEAA